MASSLSHFTKEELQKKLKLQKTYILIQSVVVMLMIVLAVISTLDKGITFLTFLPLFFIPMEIVMFFELQKIKKELQKRK